jgi:AraC-like DNA-binding protein
MVGITIANVSCRAIVNYCESIGVSSERMLAASGISSSGIAEPGGKIPAEQVFKLWQEAQDATHDAFIAGHVAARVPFGAYAIGDYLLATASTPEQALQELTGVFPLVNGAFELRLTSDGLDYNLELHNPFDREAPARLHVECFFALMQSRLRYVTGIDWQPKEVWFAHSPPLKNNRAHPAFDCRVRFKQAVNRMVFDRDFLKFHLSNADPALNEILDHHARRLLKDLPTEDHFMRDLRQALNEGLGLGDLRLRTIAKRLAHSGRALQRELNMRGTSYREEVARIRRDLAMEMLPHRSIKEMSSFLQFAEPSCFYRAFRRWTGLTPQEYLTNHKDSA